VDESVDVHVDRNAKYDNSPTIKVVMFALSFGQIEYSGQVLWMVIMSDGFEHVFCHFVSILVGNFPQAAEQSWGSVHEVPVRDAVGLAFALGDGSRAAPEEHHEGLDPLAIELLLLDVLAACSMAHVEKPLPLHHPEVLPKPWFPADDSLPLRVAFLDFVEGALGFWEVVARVDQVLEVVDVDKLAAEPLRFLLQQVLD
jgi:hypothetical protein